MAIASALPSLLTATAAPAVPWLSLNVTIVDNDRGASPSSYRARALGAGAQEVPPGTVHVIKQCFSVKMWPCQASFWSRWHDPVLGRWLGLTPEQPAHFLRGFPECPRAAPSRVGDPPGLGRRGGAQGAARGAIREKRYNLPHPGVHHTYGRAGAARVPRSFTAYNEYKVINTRPLTQLQRVVLAYTACHAGADRSITGTPRVAAHNSWAKHEVIYLVSFS